MMQENLLYEISICGERPDIGLERRNIKISVINRGLQIKSIESSVCYANRYNILHPDDGIIALPEKKSTLKKALNKPVNEFYVIRRYFS